MKKKYSKPTMKSIRLHFGILLSGSNDGITATMSGYQPSDDEGDGFSQESDGFSQESVWGH